VSSGGWYSRAPESMDLITEWIEIFTGP